MGIVRWLIVLVGVALAGLAGAAILGQAGSGAQPWDPELSDNFIFVKSIPFAIGLGVAVGLARGRGAGAQRRRADGKIERFRIGTVIGHWIATIGFLLALPTGLWQYLGGILSQDTPAPGGQLVLDFFRPLSLYLVYRVHYLGGALILFSIASFLTYWLINEDRSLLPPRGQWRAHLAGFAAELPPQLSGRVARLLRVDLAQRRPTPDRFTYFETGFSFPVWAILLTLITVTGLIKAMRYVYPVPGGILYWASTLHVASMVLIVLKVLDHLRYTLPRWPMMVAIARGWVSEGSIRSVVTGASSAPAPAADAGVARAPAMSGSDR